MVAADRPPFVDRVAELARLRDLLSRSDAAGAVLVGPLGVGKTALVTEFLRIAEAEDLPTIAVQGTVATQAIPFGAFSALLPTIVPDLPLDPVLQMADVVRTYSSALLERYATRPLLAVDDAALLDDGSAVLIRHLASQRQAVLMLTLDTVAQLRDHIAALLQIDGIAHVPIEPLTRAAMEELVVAILGGPVEPRTMSLLADRSGGSPLWLRELVLSSAEGGSLAPEGGVWKGDPDPMGERLVEVVGARVAKLPEPQRRLLDLLVVAGCVGEAELAALDGADVVSVLERRGIVMRRRVDRRLDVRLAHPIYGTVLRASISDADAKAIARFCADLVEGFGARRRGDLLRVASWRLEGGGGSAELFVQGAAAARSLHDYGLAERLARAAAAEGGGFEARFVAAEAAYLAGRREDAARELEALVPIAGDDAQRARLAIARFDNDQILGVGDDLTVIEEAEATVTDRRWRAELASRRLVLAAMKGPNQCASASEAFLADLPAGAPSFGLHIVAYAFAKLGRIHDALAVLDRADAAATSDVEGWYEPTGRRIRGLTLSYGGQFDAAERTVRPAYEDTTAAGSTERRAFAASALAEVNLERGRVAAAAAMANEAITLFRTIDRLAIAPDTIAIGAQALALAGKPRQATAFLRVLRELPTVVRVVVPTELRARAWIAIAQGAAAEAADTLAVAADFGIEIGDLIAASAALHDLARIGETSRAHGRMVAVSSHLEGDLAAMRTSHVDALVSGQPEGLERVAGRFEQIGAYLYAAEAAAAAADAYMRWRANDAASTARERARGLLAHCEGATTPALHALTEASASDQ